MKCHQCFHDNESAHRSYSFECTLFHIGQYVSLGIAKDLESDGAMVVLQWRYIVVTDCQLGPCVNLITVW